jgi:hypothetical protein
MSAMALNLRRITESLLLSVRELVPHAVALVRRFAREQYEGDDILRDEFLRAAREEIRDEVRLETLDEQNQLLEAEIRSSLREELEDQAIQDLFDEHRESVRADLREELQEETRKEVKEEAMANITANSRIRWARQAEEAFGREEKGAWDAAMRQLVERYKDNAYKAIGLNMMADEEFRRHLELLIGAHRRIDEAMKGQEKVWLPPTRADLRNKRGIRKLQGHPQDTSRWTLSTPTATGQAAAPKSNLKRRAANDDGAQPGRPGKRIGFDLAGEEPQVPSIIQPKAEPVEGEFESSVVESEFTDVELVSARARGEVNQQEVNSPKTWDKEDFEESRGSRSDRRLQHCLEVQGRLEGKGLFYPERSVVSSVLVEPLLQWDLDSSEEQEQAAAALHAFELEARALGMADESIVREKKLEASERPLAYQLAVAGENRRKELGIYPVKPMVPRKRKAVDELLPAAKRRRSC